MPLSEPIFAALRDANIHFERDVSLVRRTYWRAGGPADALVAPSNTAELALVQRIALTYDVPVLPLGNASNLLISDRGVRGLVVVLDGDLATVTEIGTEAITAGGGTKLVVLLARAAKHGWTGLEWAAGIPGTVGGAVRMNAGSALGEAKDAIIDVTVALPGGQIAVLGPDQLQMTYRSTTLPPGAIVASARLRLTGGDAVASQARVKAFIDKRKATQPLDLPSCGSTFRNPPGDAAGRLIESVGLKGFTIGGAQVSQKHANFVVNLGGATAHDIRAVIEHIERTVLAKAGVALEREVIYAGEW